MIKDFKDILKFYLSILICKLCKKVKPEERWRKYHFISFSTFEWYEMNNSWIQSWTAKIIFVVFLKKQNPTNIPNYLKLRSGEKIFDRIEPIEDTKGNSRIKGRMVITNLRIIWHALTSPRINLSIGLNCILSTSTKTVNSGLRGTTQALYMLAAYKTSRYEFVFTNLSPNCIRHYTSVVGVHKAYAGSRLYRDLKLRGVVIHNNQLNVLPLEKILLREHSIWNLSSDAGNLGTMLVTNVRVVWFADVNEHFNVSMPYITIENISVRDSKFGEALVFVTHKSSGGFVLGFRADPKERLKPLATELQALHQAYNEKPVFGVEINWENELPQSTTEDISSLPEVGEARGEMGPSLYLATQLPREHDTPVYSQYIGMAVEPLSDGLTMKGLFEVQSSV